MVAEGEPALERDATRDDYESVRMLEKGITLKELQGMDTAEIAQRFDRIATSEHGNWIMSAQDYLDELNRRETADATKQLIVLTKILTYLTIAIALLTVVAVYAALTE